MLYGVKAYDVMTRNGGFLKEPKPTAVLHRGKTRRSNYHWRTAENVVKCCGNAITTGRWSFRAEKDWDPMVEPDSLENTVAFFEGRKVVPAWAYEMNLCRRCFPESVELKQCNMGHNHYIKKERASARG